MRLELGCDAEAAGAADSGPRNSGFYTSSLRDENVRGALTESHSLVIVIRRPTDCEAPVLHQTVLTTSVSLSEAARDQ